VAGLLNERQTCELFNKSPGMIRCHCIR